MEARQTRRMTAPVAATIWRSPRPVDLAIALAPVQRGAGDPTQRRAADGWWRPARPPVGPAALQLSAVAGEVRAAAWGDGAAWVIDRVPSLLGDDDDATGFVP